MQEYSQPKSRTSKNIETLNADKHSHLKKIAFHHFPHIKTEQFVPVNIDELSFAATCFPLFFIKNKSDARLFPIALFGATKGQNVFYSDEKWQASYVPLSMKTWPFMLAPVTSGTDMPSLQVAADINSVYFSQIDGQNLFISGKPSPLLKRVADDLMINLEQKKSTLNFVEFLLNNELIKRIKFELGFLDDEKQFVDGLYAIDEDVLNALNPQQVQELYTKGYFKPIYSMLTSQHNLYELIKRSQYKAGSKALVSLSILNT